MGDRATRKRRLARLEAEARRAPEAFARKVLWMTVAGYAALLLAVALLLVLPLGLIVYALVAGLRGVGLVFLLLPLAAGAAVARALVFKFVPPAGIVLRDDEGPELRAEVERVRQSTGAPPVSAIHIDGDLNAALATLPVAGGLRGHRHVLVLGLPLLHLLDREELAAVVAHELDHAAQAGGGVDGWLRRMRASLMRTAQDDGEWVTSYGYVLRRLLQWYVPYLEAHAHVRDRSAELHADAAAARATSPATEASTSLRVALATQRCDVRVAERLRAMARWQAFPPAQPHAWLAGVMDRERAADPARILAISAIEPGEFDSHPQLARRLEALGVAPALRAPGAPALALLGNAADRVERALDDQWRDALRDDFAGWHADAAAGQARLAELRALLTPDDDEAFECAVLAATLAQPAVDAVAAFRDVVSRAPDRADARLRLGVALLDAGEGDAGVAELRAALDVDRGALRAVHAALDARWRDPDLDATVVTAITPLRDELAATLHTEALRDGDDATEADDADVQPHGLDADTVAALQSALAPHPKVARAWIVRRRLDLADARPHFLLLLDWRGSVAGERAGLAKVGASLRLPGSHTLLTGSHDAALAGRIRTRAMAPVFERGRG